MKEWLYLTPGLALTVLLLAVAHWMFLKLPLPLPRLWAYRIGVSCIWSGFALWRLLMGDWVTVVGLFALCVVSGAAVASFYWIDYQLDTITEKFHKADKGERHVTQRE